MIHPPPAGPEDGADDLVVYDLGDWTPEQRAALDRLLVGEGVTHEWDAGEAAASSTTPSPESGPTSAWAGQLVVPEASADLVEELIDELDHPDALEPDDGGDGGGGEVLSSLYVASDVLLSAPGHVAAAQELREAAAVASTMEAPYGLDDATWGTVRRRAETLAAVLATGEEEGVKAAAQALREVVRPLV